jgi:hypothetical protein
MTDSSEPTRPQQDPRVQIRLRARISTIDPETDPFTGKPFFRTCEESSANLSQSGVFVAMRDTIPPGRRVLIEIDLPGDRTVQTVGRVAWTRTTSSAEKAPAGAAQGKTESGVGIEFLGGPRHELQALESFVARTLRRRRDDLDPNSGVPVAVNRG